MGDDSWLDYSQLDSSRFTLSLSVFSLVSSVFVQPLNVLMVRQQAGISHPQTETHSANVTVASSASGSGAGSGSKSGFVNVNANAAFVGNSYTSVNHRNDGLSHNIFADLTKSVKEIGVRGLFRGWVPVAIMGLPTNVISLSITESSREYLQLRLKSNFPQISSVYVDGIQASITSVLASTLSLIPFVPADVLSSRLIAQGRKGISSYEMAKIVYKENGFKGFYKGFNISLLICTCYGTQWWWVYSVVRRNFRHHSLTQDNPILLDSFAGLTSGLFTTLCLHPLDTIKAKIMTGMTCPTTNNSIVKVFGNIVKTEGMKGLWRGLPASLYQTALSSTGFAISYELIKRFSASQRQN